VLLDEEKFKISLPCFKIMLCACFLALINVYMLQLLQYM
jgi:hypothetical protein